ncbi:hypothetical protein JCM31598_39550 [Desulfonatronum parangueonense]
MARERAKGQQLLVQVKPLQELSFPRHPGMQPQRPPVLGRPRTDLNGLAAHKDQLNPRLTYAQGDLGWFRGHFQHGRSVVMRIVREYP